MNIVLPFVLALSLALPLPRDAGRQGPGTASRPAADQESGDPDALFARAREMGFDGQRPEARSLCRRILETSPGYHDVRVFLARLHAWDGEYPAAREELDRVLDEAPGHYDARLAMADVARWSGDAAAALEHAEAGLVVYPDDPGLLDRRARALWTLERLDDALQATDRLLEVEPDFPNARSMRERIVRERARTELTLGYGYDRFNDFDDPWQLFRVNLARELSFGTVHARVNTAHRFGETAVQYEVDAYPRLREGVYAYLNYGYSSRSFFPRNRAGAELFVSLPRALEASFGFRYLDFAARNVTIWTGSVGKYVGNYWISLRPYVTPGDDGTSLSASVTTRRYFADPEHYVSFTAGGGSAPGGATSALDLDRLDSAYGGVGWNWPVSPRWILSVDGSLSREELPFDRDRNRFNFSGGITRRF